MGELEKAGSWKRAGTGRAAGELESELENFSNFVNFWELEII
jgi:hypothetical protein